MKKLINRHNICPKFYTDGFPGQKCYTVNFNSFSDKNTKHRKHWESCPTQVTWKVKLSGLCVLSVFSDLSALFVLSVLMTMITMTTLTTMSTMMIVTMTTLTSIVTTITILTMMTLVTMKTRVTMTMKVQGHLWRGDLPDRLRTNQVVVLDYCLE